VRITQAQKNKQIRKEHEIHMEYECLFVCKKPYPFFSWRIFPSPQTFLAISTVWYFPCAWLLGSPDPLPHYNNLKEYSSGENAEGVEGCVF
jgi:hypothetical protein